MMKKLKYIIAVVFFCIVAIGNIYSQNIPESIVTSFKTGNAVELAKYFNTNVELVILEDEDVYSKAQSEIIVKNFFAKNNPTDFKILHQGGKEEAKYAIGNLTTANKTYRVYFLLKSKNEKLFIHQLRIEDNDE